MTRRYPLHIHISTLFIALILVVGGVIGGLGYKISRDLLENSARELNARISRETAGEFNIIVGPAEMASRLISRSTIVDAKSLAERLKRTEFMREALSNSPTLTSVYVGYDNGDFFMLRRIWSDSDRQTFAAPAGTAYIVESIEHQGGQRHGRFIYLDEGLSTLRSLDSPEYAARFDPRTRNWYQLALHSAGQIKTPPYVFFSTRQVGTTIANRAGKSGAVVGVDIRLETLAELLARHKVTPGTEIALVNFEGYTISSESLGKALRVGDGDLQLPRLQDLGSPVLAEFAARFPRLEQHSAEHLVMQADGAHWHVSVNPVVLEGAGKLFLVTAIPDDELMSTAKQLISYSLLATLLIILLAVPITWLLARNISRALRQLAGEAEAIRRLDFAQPITVKSLILEVQELSVTMDSMKRAIRHFLEISMAVAAETDFTKLLPRLLSETIRPIGAAAGILYLADNDELHPTTALLADGNALPLDPTALLPAAAGPLLGGALAASAARSGRLSAADGAALGLAGLLPATPASHGVAIPLLNRRQQLVGTILLLCHDEVDAAHLGFVEALSGSLAVSLESRELIRDQKLLFEAFIQMLAGAIDAKSPYTGGHCARVPELAKMLARAACAETAGPFKDFQLDAEAWEALHVAAWLHDCGKVTTPEYVVDKATKLETIYDRIHEVRMRFEVLKRDAEIACLTAIAAGHPAGAAQADLARQLARLDDDFRFVAECNAGGEFMAPDKIARLQKIATRTWTRTLDDRLGIAQEEKKRKERTPAPSLPVSEPLLADRPEHLIERPPREQMPAANRWGIRMEVPELLYNRGELYNLAVARGTLSAEERYKINEHIVQTLIMLSQLPFPKHLREVPEIAAGHHEKMDGSGYPRRLVRDQMSPLARMMAIADIFEALTADDRPYKQGKKLSEALRIMSFMKKDNHIDPELFDLFLRAGVYRDYAARFMAPEQIDAVDIGAYLTPAVAA